MRRKVFNCKGSIVSWLLIITLFVILSIAGVTLFTNFTGSSNNKILTPLEVDPNVKLHEKVDYYKISGDTEEKLQEQLTKKSPFSYAGFTKWYLKWDYDEVKADNKCSLKNPKVDLAITVTLPKWNTDESDSEDLKNKWDNFASKLTEHELQHRKFAVTHANTLAQTLPDLTSSDCNKLKDLVNSEGEKTIAEINSEDKKYDSETNHGKNEGAIIP